MKRSRALAELRKLNAGQRQAYTSATFSSSMVAFVNCSFVWSVLSHLGQLQMLLVRAAAAVPQSPWANPLPIALALGLSPPLL